jgi:hypothetical protein
MKTYDVNMVFTAHANLMIEANSQKEAIELAWQQVERDASFSNPEGIWELGYADEMGATK